MRPPKKVLQDAQECLSRGEGAFGALPSVVKSMIRDEVWKHLTDKNGKCFADFPSFVEYNLWWGLETSYDRLIDFCRDDAECRQMLLEQMPAVSNKGGQEGNGNAAKEKNEGDNITLVSNPRGTSATHTLKRLKRDNPELAERVVNGDLSANAAAIEAGFRKPTITLQSSNPVRAAETIHAKFGPEFAQALKEAL